MDTFTWICAWCKKRVEKVAMVDKKNPDNEATHGICEECRDKVLSDLSLK